MRRVLDGAAEADLIQAARAGDGDAFNRLVAPHARSLHVHCYRMLGSLQDAEDALQETLVRAWRGLAGFGERSSFRRWLYRIATNVCLTALARRRPLPAPPEALPPAPEPDDQIILSPYPDTLLSELPSLEPEPEARYDSRESVQLAFVAAVQLLPPRQRAALLLHDVLGWTADEIAELLETTRAGVNSALQRARETLERRRADGRLELGRAQPAEGIVAEVVSRFVSAWEAADISRLVALLREDALMTMPPAPLLYRGSRVISDFFATVPLEGALDRTRLLITGANGQPAVAVYFPDEESGRHRAYGLMVLVLEDEQIAEIVGFADPSLFPAFGLPAELPNEARLSSR
jgi:RNA polymerase sigma-70 factor (ECF subfamily)